MVISFDCFNLIGHQLWLEIIVSPSHEDEIAERGNDNECKQRGSKLDEDEIAEQGNDNKCKERGSKLDEDEIADQVNGK